MSMVVKMVILVIKMLYDKINNNDDDVDDDDGDYYDNDDDYDVGNDFRPPKLFLALSDTLFFMI